MAQHEVPTVRIAKIQLKKAACNPEIRVQGYYPNGVSEEDLGLPTLEPEDEEIREYLAKQYSSDPDNEERKRVNPNLFLGIEDEEEAKAIQEYFDRTRSKKAEELLDKGWASSPESEEVAPETAKRPRLSMCMAAVSFRR